MYSFEGDYKRKPEQCLAGASIVTERNELLQHAREQRLKREEHRKRTKSTVLIQAYFRSYMTRKRAKINERVQFDEMVQHLRAQSNVNKAHLLNLIKKLLFFYNDQEDRPRLILITQCVLKDHVSILTLAGKSDNSWSWFLRWLLNLNLNYIAELVKAGSQDPITVPLRFIETFTSLETLEKVLGEEAARAEVTRHLEYLVRQGYFQKLWFVLDQKTPPLLTVSSQPPTPLVGFLFGLIAKPLQLSAFMMPNVFNSLVDSLCRHVLSPRLTDPVKMFVIPSLIELPSFPFRQMVHTLRDCIGSGPAPHPLHSTSMLFSLLSLEKNHFVIGSAQVTTADSIAYLQVLAAMTSNLCKLAVPAALDEDEDDEMDPMAFEETHLDSALHKDELEILEQCCVLMNVPSRVQGLIQVVDETSEPLVLQALCQICHNLLISSKLAVHKYRLLYMLAFKPNFLRHLWTSIQRVSQTSVFGYSTPLINMISRGIPMSGEDSERIVPLLAVFCSLLNLFTGTLHDSELYGDGPGSGSASGSVTAQTLPFTLPQLVPMTRLLKDVCLGLLDLAYPESRPSVKESIDGIEALTVPSQQTHLWSNLFKVVVGLVRHLHGRDNRRPFCPEGHWISKQVQVILGVYQPTELALRRRRLRGYRPFQGLRAFTREELEEGGPPLTTKEVRTATLLNELPFLIAFQERVMIFQTIVLKDKLEHQEQSQHFLQGPSIHISVRRNYLYEDAFEKLSLDNEPELRLKMRVRLVNRAGLDEAGVDGGGLFREFLSELLKTAFDPNRGFFRLTKDNLLYPNPSVHLLVEDFTKHYVFIGRILGKALYENLLVELPLAEFFLHKLVGRHLDVDMHHLASLDPIMYRNLLFLKNYEGDVLDLGLDFTIINEELGETRMDELKPGGSSTPVTSFNRIEYIHLMADYKVNKQMRAQCNAMRQGLANVIPLDWIHMFNSKELQVLISGAEIPVDVEDLKQHTNYAGGYAEEHPTIQLFWKAVRAMTDLQRRQLLKFVTSCSRPPLLGFKELDPPFCIQHAGTSDRLPSASTCMNLLKLPAFPDEKQMTEKLLYAIQSGAGFELS